MAALMLVAAAVVVFAIVLGAAMLAVYGDPSEDVSPR